MNRDCSLAIKGLIILSTLICVSSTLIARDVRLYRSAYFLGRGDTGIANADGHEAITYNPAGIAKGKGIYKETVLASPLVEGSAAIKDLYRKYVIEKNTDAETLVEELGKNQHVGFYNYSGLVFRRAALGATVSSTTNLLPYRSSTYSGLPVVQGETTANQVVTFALAENFFSKNFFMGLTGKYINRQEAALSVAIAEADNIESKLSDSNILNTAYGFGGDLGIMYRSNSKKAPFSIGLTVENVGNINMTGATQKDKMEALPQMVNFGISIEPKTRASAFKFLADYRDILSGNESNSLKKIHLGTELSIKDMIGITSGFNQGYPSIGAYIDTYVFRFDIGSYTEEVSERVGNRPDQRFFLRMKTGF